MLVLSRRSEERILAGSVQITVVEVRGDKVRLGIDAPQSVPIHRHEVLLAISQQSPAHLAALGYELSPSGLVVPQQSLRGAA